MMRLTSLLLPHVIMVLANRTLLRDPRKGLFLTAPNWAKLIVVRLCIIIYCSVEILAVFCPH